ncbi:MAG: hypothetical protein Q9160_000354 [Pyrenula sp. 1 TL-2023]
MRPSRARTGTTPLRKEDPTVAEFGRLLGVQQQQEEAQRSKDSTSPPSTTRPAASEPTPTIQKEKVATEVLLFGYASKDSEWRVISKYERIVAPQGFIYEDYDRTDPNQPLTSTSYFSSINSNVPRGPLTKEGLKKSRKYRGGAHWIKVTYDSYESAERAVFYSPQDIENHLVFAQMWNGQPPFSDVAIPKASQLATDLQRQLGSKIRTLTTSDSNHYLAAAAPDAHSGAQTLPRSFIAPNSQYLQPAPQDDASISTSTTASSATATNSPPPSLLQGPASASTTSLPSLTTNSTSSGLRSRSTPSLPLTPSLRPRTPSRLKDHPSVRRAVLRPISEALPPAPSLTERVLRNIPIINWFVAPAGKGPSGGGVGEEVLTNEKGEFDWERNGLYWRIWGTVDWALGTDCCGLRAD